MALISGIDPILFQIFCDNSANFARKANALVVVDLLAGSCICT